MEMYPQLGPQYYNEQDKGILARMEAFYAESITINQSFWGEADNDTRFYCGDQTLWNDIYGNLPANRRSQFSFNRIRPIVNITEGYQRDNRKSMVATPIENGDDDTADQFTKILLWVSNQEGVLETLSDAFKGALITGMNILEVWVDYRTDPISGNIRVDNTSYNGFLIDPYFRKHDLSDCNAIWKRSFITKKEVLSLMPDQEEQIMMLHGNSYGNGRDGKFQFMPESYNYGVNNLLSYDQFYYRDYRTQKLLVDKQSGETQEWKGQDEDMLKIFLETYPQIEVVEQEIPTVRLAIVVQGKVLYHGPNPNGTDKYPFVVVLGYYHPELPYFPFRIQGMVRGLRDAQYLYNRRKIIELDILESQITSGFKFKENALVNPEDIYLSGQGRGIAIKQEAAMADVEKIIAPEIPQSMIQLSDILSKEINMISGVNEELLGSAMDDKAGVLSMLRQGAGLRTLKGLFDNLDRSQKLLGQLILDIVTANWTPGKVKKVLEGEEPTAQFYNKAFGRYGIAIEDGLNTTTQKQMQLAQLLQLREIGVPVPDDVLLEACTLQNKKKLIESIQQAKQKQDEMQQAQMQAQTQQIQAQAELYKSRAEADRALGHERDSHVDTNRAMTIRQLHEAALDDEKALLEKVKILKEIGSIDISHIRELIEAAIMLKQSNEPDLEKVKGEAKKKVA